MSETREGIVQLYEVAAESMEAIVTANELEAEAARLRREGPENVDRGIVRVTSLLAAETRAGNLTPRESLEAALEINQFTPSNVIGHRPPARAKLLETFDSLCQADTPYILPDEYTALTGFTTGKTPKLRVVQVSGKGGLPDTAITFGSHRVFRDKEDIARTEVAVEPLLLSLRGLAMITAGSSAIQDRLDSTKFVSRSYACGHGHKGNEKELRILFDAATLMSEAGVELSTEALQTEMIKANALTVREIQNARREARS